MMMNFEQGTQGRYWYVNRLHHLLLDERGGQQHNGTRPGPGCRGHTSNGMEPCRLRVRLVLNRCHSIPLSIHLIHPRSLIPCQVNPCA